MTRIVTSVPRPKRTSKKRKAVAIVVPAVVVTAKRSRHPLPLPVKQAAAEVVVSLPQSEAVQPKHIAAANDDQKPVIVTSISRKRARQRHAGYTAAEPGVTPSGDTRASHDPKDEAPTDDTLMRAMARMIRPPNRVD